MFDVVLKRADAGATPLGLALNTIRSIVCAVRSQLEILTIVVLDDTSEVRTFVAMFSWIDKTGTVRAHCSNRIEQFASFSISL